jgi:type II secretory pathway pseudopilin PulG
MNIKNKMLHRLAFSLIEVIGVLSVLAIGALIVVSATTKSVDVSVSKQESTTLQTFAIALQNSILRNRYIPGSADWYQIVATEMGISASNVLYNTRNPASQRVLMVDPNFSTGVAGLPYAQGTNGASQLVSNRVMIVSSIAPGIPIPSTGVTSANFDTVWSTADGSVPSSFGTWGGTGDDVKIQRINLGPLFAKLTLLTCPTNATALGQYQEDGSVTMTVTATPPGNTGYYLLGTLIELLTDSGLGGTTNGRVMLDSDIGFYYVGSAWRNVQSVPIGGVGIGGTQNQTNADAQNLAMMISAAAAAFAASPANSGATGGVTPPQTLNVMSNFMASYIPYANWAQTSGLGFVKSGPYYPAASSNQTLLYNAMNNLGNGITEGGCP